VSTGTKTRRQMVNSTDFTIDDSHEPRRW